MHNHYDEFGHRVISHYTVIPITVAGVTFKNGRRSRQTILRQIFWKDEPYQRYDPDDCIDLVTTVFDNEPAVEIWFRNKKSREMIGYIPKEEAPFFCDNMNRYDGHFDFSVYGGGKNDDGSPRSFGASFTVRFRNREEDPPRSSDLENTDQAIPKPKEDSLSPFAALHSSPHHQRAYSLFLLSNPSIKNCTYIEASGTNKICILIYVSKKHLFNVVYDNVSDSIKVYDVSFHYLYSYPNSTIRANSESTEKKKKSSPLSRLLVFCIFFAFVLFVLAYFR